MLVSLLAFEAQDARAAKVVELRFFGGLERLLQRLLHRHLGAQEIAAGLRHVRQALRRQLHLLVFQQSAHQLGARIVFQGRVRAFIPNAPAGTIAGPEREGSTPALELLRPAQATAAGGQKNGTGQ